MDDQPLIYFLTALLAGVPVLIFFYYNKDSKKVERFFHEHDGQMYIMLEAALFILTVAFFMNIRVFAQNIFKAFLVRWGLDQFTFAPLPSKR